MAEWLLSLLLLGGPSGGVYAPRTACSASGLALPLAAQPGLPAPVAKIRQEIARAAVQCDFSQLQKLAWAGPSTFNYTFGQRTTPAKHWQAEEAGGQRPLYFLVRVLSLPFVKEGEGQEAMYYWPSAYREKPTPDDWAALKGLYSDEQIQTYRDAEGYMGYRLGITPSGDWTFFIAGD